MVQLWSVAGCPNHILGITMGGYHNKPSEGVIHVILQVGVSQANLK